jgi:hypothetical protein
MPAKRKHRFSEDSLRLLALQAHQISGTLDPRLPMSALLEPELGRKRGVEGRSFDLARKLRDPEVARIINDRLAPAH